MNKCHFFIFFYHKTSLIYLTNSEIDDKKHKS
jgi:hypothetical protein